jgi:hypothetical protein
MSGDPGRISAYFPSPGLLAAGIAAAPGGGAVVARAEG